MKITRVKAVNFEGIVNIDTLLGKNVNKITGRNGAGKSSFRDSIIATLCGAKYTPDVPIRTGQNKAEVTVDMGEYIVKGTYTKAGRKIEVLSPDGAKFSRPQELMDKCVGRLSFDPTEFYRKTSREQAEMLRELVGLDVSDIEAAYRKTQDERAQINSNKTLLQQKLNAIAVPADTPDEEVSISGLAKQLQEANNHNIQQNEMVAKVKSLADDCIRHGVAIADHQNSLEKYRTLMDEAAVAKEKCIQAREELLNQKEVLEKTIPPIQDTSPIQAQIEQAERINRNVHLKQQKTELQAAVDLKTIKYTELGRTMKSLDATKAARLAEIKMPVDSLSLTEEYVTYGDLPLKQINTGEQLKIAVAIAMAMNPTLKTVFVKCNDLDSDNLKLLEDMLIERDYQGFFEIADTSGKIGIVIEDGTLKKIEGDTL